MEIFNIFGKVVTLGHTYFRVVRCCLSMFLASVLVRVLHPCVVLAPWKLLRGCGWAMAAVRPLEQMFGLNFFGANTIYCNTADLDLPCATCIGGTALGTISGL